MDIPSALLTKKAALVGGGAAATTTAVVVPVAVTQSKGSDQSSDSKESVLNKTKDLDPTKVTTKTGEEENSTLEKDSLEKVNPLKDNPLDYLSTNLDLKGDSFFKSFNKPGDCIKKSFLGIEKEIASTDSNKKGLFKKPDSVTSQHASFTTLKLTGTDGNPNLTDFDYACVMFNRPTDENSKTFRFELTLKKGDYGWIWMAGKTDRTVSFREAIVHKKQGQNDWEGYRGTDGKFTETGEQDFTPLFTDEIFKNLKPWKATECIEGNNKDCTEKQTLAGVFIKGGDVETKFLTTKETDWSRTIPSWGTNKDYGGTDGNKRWSFFADNGWYKNHSSQANVVNFEKATILDSMKGTWRDLIDYCQDDSNNKGEAPYSLLCAKPS